MSLTATVALPSPVFLLPGVTGAAVVEPELQVACVEVLRRACARAEVVCVIAAEHEIGAPRPPQARTPGRRWHPPLGHQVAQALLAEAGWRGRIRELTPSADASASECAEVGGSVVKRSEATALVVMGDFSACARPDSPTWYDPAAAAYDEVAERALTSGDPHALLNLDPTAARTFLVSGRAPWQAMAGAWLAAGGGRRQVDVRWAGAPFDVDYRVVAFTEPCDAS